MKRWLLITATSWSLLHFLIFLIAPFFIVKPDFIPFQEVAKTFNLPPFLTVLSHFDGAHYILIAREGYHTYEQAFFPLYPLSIHLLGNILDKNFLLAGLLISFVSFLLGLFFFKNVSQFLTDEKKSGKYTWIWTMLALLTFPTAFYLTTVYTESLFFFLIMASLYFLFKKDIYLAAVFALLASLSRLIGVFLFIPIGFWVLQEYFGKKQAKYSPKNFLQSNYKALVVVIAPFIGLLIYCIYLKITTGDPLFFLNSQPAFGAQRSSSLILPPQVVFRYIKIFLNATPNFQYLVSVIEFVMFSVVTLILTLDLIHILLKKNQDWIMRLGLNIFSFINLMLPVLTGTLSSIPRYALMSVSVFLYVGEIKNIFIKSTILVLFAALHIFLFALYIQGYFVS